MKLVGDVPEEHRQLAEELEEAELYWDNRAHRLGYPEEVIAKAYVCLAHDWYSIGEEDHGAMLLQKAENVCPGYFKEVLLLQAQEDKDFDYLVKRLMAELAWMLVSRINEVKES